METNAHEIVAGAILYGITGHDGPKGDAGYALIDACQRIDRLARAWEWTAVEAELDRAYLACGSVNLGAGHDYHCGAHPVQAAMRELKNCDD